MNVPAPNLSAPGVSIVGGVDLLLGLLGMRDTRKRVATINRLHGHVTRVTARVGAVEKQWGTRQAPGGGRQWVPYHVILAHWMDPSTHQQQPSRSQDLASSRNVARGDRSAVRDRAEAMRAARTAGPGGSQAEPRIHPLLRCLSDTRQAICRVSRSQTELVGASLS
jgi:hypothetical protein